MQQPIAACTRAQTLTRTCPCPAAHAIVLALHVCVHACVVKSIVVKGLLIQQLPPCSPQKDKPNVLPVQNEQNSLAQQHKKTTQSNKK